MTRTTPPSRGVYRMPRTVMVANYNSRRMPVHGINGHGPFRASLGQWFLYCQWVNGFERFMRVRKRKVRPK